MLDNGFSVSMNAGFAGACNPEDDDYNQDLNCKVDPSDGLAVCLPGFQWQDPDSDTNFQCIPKDDQPQNASTGTASVPPVAAITMYVTASALNVRLGPSTGYKSVGTISKNTAVQAVQGYPALLETVPQGVQVGDASGAFISPTKDNWVYITQIQSTGVGKAGWVSGKYLAEKPATVSDPNTPPTTGSGNTNVTQNTQSNVTQNTQSPFAPKLSMVGLAMLAGAAYLLFKATK